MACSWPRTCTGCKKLDRILDRQGQACAVCAYFGPDADDAPVCHKFLKTMLPCDGCGEWRERLEETMERLTYDFCIGSNHCWQIKGADNFICKEVCIKQGDDGCTNCPIKKAFDRLAAYEDTGLEPGEVLTGKEMAEVGCAIIRLKKYEDIGPIDHLRELAQAEKHGRLMVLPCKVGDTVWTNIAIVGDRYKSADRPYPVEVVFIGMGEDKGFFHVQYSNGRVFPFDFDKFGKTVFLTREEAEAALEKREEKNHEQNKN